MASDLKVIRGDLREHGDPIAAIQARLRKYPQVRSVASPHEVVVFPLDASGFTVRFRELGAHSRVECGGWRGEFQELDAALECFIAALGPASRLQVRLRGRWPYRWQLQRWQDGHWFALQETGHVLFPFWLRENRNYLQNRLLEAA
jgi:hypothetical protein